MILPYFAVLVPSECQESSILIVVVSQRLKSEVNLKRSTQCVNEGLRAPLTTI